jgi:hypothetical protein
MMRAEKAEARVRALETELIESAKRFGRTIKDLKAKKYIISLYCSNAYNS